MARIAVVTSHPPFASGGHLLVARSLVSALADAGHRADLLMTPQNRFGRQGAAYLATWLTDVGLSHDGHRIDQIITLRFPSYALRHPVHVCWLNHRMREYYDLWDRFAASLSRKGRIKEGLRRFLIHRADRYLLTRNVTMLFAQSRTVQARLRRWGDIPSEVLYPAPPPRPYRCEGYRDYLFAVSRLTPLKRVDLLVEALARPEAAGIRCVIAGEGEDFARLSRLIRDRDIGDRVTLAGAIGEDALLDHLARCRAACFVPFEEDFGFVTTEAFASAKAVVTCTDSGGPAELVRHGVNGFAVTPDPAALACALRQLIDDRSLAERMGEAAAAQARDMSWARVVERLLLV